MSMEPESYLVPWLTKPLTSFLRGPISEARFILVSLHWGHFAMSKPDI